MVIDIERLRSDLMDEYGTAMHAGFPMAMMELSKIEHASEGELIRLAERKGIDLSKYVR